MNQFVFKVFQKKSKIVFEFEVIDSSDNQFDFSNTEEALHQVYVGLSKLPLVHNSKWTKEEL